jgi:serine/threonine-protein kinase
MSEPSQQTAAYDERPPTDPQSEEVRVVFVAGSGVVADDDLYQLLRRRLLILTTILASVTFVNIAVNVAAAAFFIRRPVPPDPTDVVKVFAQLILFSASAVLLWRRPPRSAFGLRLVEVLTVGLLVLGGLEFVVRQGAYGYLERASAEEDVGIRAAFVERYTLLISLVFFIITAYAALIPNTRRRAAIVIGLIAMAPLIVFAVNAFWLRPLPPYRAGMVLMMHSFFNAVAVTIGVFSSSRIEYYRRQASEARRFGQYVLKEKLGEGGMGEVYRAEHALLRRPCALKLIRPDRARDPAALRRFEREVQVTATLTHPNTVQIYDYGHAADGTFYYVMEYLPGLTLEQIVCRHGPLPPGRAVHFLRQVCAALAEAHAHGLTHRDIKPGNVMICERGGIRDVVKLLDFGLVLPPAGDLEAATLTREGVVAGTPAFMSPEQAGGQDGIDPRSDLYSVGALAYFLLTGKPPFAGRPTVKTLAAHLYESPPDLPEDIPPDLSAVVMRCLAKAPAERWLDAASLEAALTEVAALGWTADDARAWWERLGSDRETDPVLATATQAESGK